MNLFQQNETEFLFESVSDRDGWGTETGSSFTLTGLATMSSSKPLDTDRATTEASSELRAFFKLENKTDLEAVSIGDRVTVRGAVFEVTRLDLEGRLPGSYKLRIEAKRSDQ